MGADGLVYSSGIYARRMGKATVAINLERVPTALPRRPGEPRSGGRIHAEYRLPRLCGTPVRQVPTGGRSGGEFRRNVPVPMGNPGIGGKCGDRNAAYFDVFDRNGVAVWRPGRGVPGGGCGSGGPAAATRGDIGTAGSPQKAPAAPDRFYGVTTSALRNSRSNPSAICRKAPSALSIGMSISRRAAG